MLSNVRRHPLFARSTPARREFQVGSLVLCLSTVGCAGAVREATEAAAPPAVESTVDELHEPYNRDKIAGILQDNEIRLASAELIGGAVGGAFDALTEEERVERLAIATGAYASKLTLTFAERWEHDVRPQISRSMNRTFDESLARLMGEETEERAAAIARTVAREAALGFQDAVQEAQRKRDGNVRPEGDILATAGDAAEATESALDVTPWLIGTIAAAVAGASGFFLAKRRES